MSDIETLMKGLGLSASQVEQLQTNLRTLKTEKLMELDADIARSKEGMHITRAGLNVLAKAMTGKELQYTRVAFGDGLKDGVMIEPTDSEILEYTALIHEREMELPLADVRFGGNGTAVVTFQINNTNLMQGFWARELGIFVKEPDTGKEILYAYKNSGALSSYLEGGGGAVAKALMMSCVTIIDQATNVTAIIDADLLFVSQTELLDHVNSTKPHPNVPNLAPEMISTDYVWVTNSDTQLHPMKISNLQTQILGDNINSLSLIQSRLAQTEINLANLYTQLNAEKTLGLEANLLLFEDFADCSTIDQTKVRVNDQVAGGYQVCVESLDGLLEGHFYTITDGNKSQVVQIESLARNDELLVVIFTEKLNHTFNLKKCWLYRSTGSFDLAAASGAGDTHTTTVKFPDEWTGMAASTDKSLTWKTTTANEKNLEAEGYCAFTADGFFTIG